MSVGDFDEIVQRQLGLLTRSQAIGFFGRGSFEKRVKRGNLVRYWNGVYRVAGAPVSDELPVMAASLAYGGPASHRASAALRGFDRYGELRPEVTVLGQTGTRKRPIDHDHELTVHRTNFLPDEHIEVVRGIPTTTAARTICDLSVFLSAPSLGRLLDDARRRGLVSYEEVAACRADIRARGRRRTSVVDELLEFRGFGFDPGGSEPELKLRVWLEDAGLPPVAQHPVLVGGKKRLLDLAYPGPMVAVEYLGIDPHTLAARVVDDSQRTTELQLAGWLVILITKGTPKWQAVQMVRDAIAGRGGL